MASEQSSTKSASVDDGWVAVQQKTFTKWVNIQLGKQKREPITDLALDFDTGIKLMELVNSLYGLPIPKHNAKPKIRAQMLDNCEIALNMVKEANIKTNFVSTFHLADHDLKMLLGLTWSIILDYAIKGIHVEDSDSTGTEGLLLWVRKKTAGYEHVDPPGINNFGADWQNGMAFAALIHRFRPDLIDYSSLDPSKRHENVSKMLDIAESQLGIMRLVDVEDIADTKYPDERSILTYVASFYHYFSQLEEKQAATRRAIKFLRFEGELDQLKQEYVDDAKAFIEWTNDKIEHLFEAPILGLSLDEAIKANSNFKKYLLLEKPEKVTQRVDLDTKYAEIQTKIRITNRASWEPPTELAPSALISALDRLENAESEYYVRIRDNRFSFIKKSEMFVPESSVVEWNDAFDAFDHNHDSKIDFAQFRGALMALGSPLAGRDESSVKKLFADQTKEDYMDKPTFIRFMTEQTQDHDTEDEIVLAFQSLSPGNDVIDIAALHGATADEKKYFQKLANGDTLNYRAVIDSAFRSNIVSKDNSS